MSKCLFYVQSYAYAVSLFITSLLHWGSSRFLSRCIQRRISTLASTAECRYGEVTMECAPCTCIISPWWGDTTFAWGASDAVSCSGEAGVRSSPDSHPLFSYISTRSDVYIFVVASMLFGHHGSHFLAAKFGKDEKERERERAVPGGAPSTYSKHFATTATTPNSNATGTNALAVSASPSANVAVVVVVDFLVVAAVAGDRERRRRSGADDDVGAPPVSSSSSPADRPHASAASLSRRSSPIPPAPPTMLSMAPLVATHDAGIFPGRRAPSSAPAIVASGKRRPCSSSRDSGSSSSSSSSSTSTSSTPASSHSSSSASL